jgi:ribosome-associated heat shock protein Hsp15
MRIDKFLWCVRLYKSRSMAADASDRGHVRSNGSEVKPSREVKPGDMIDIRVPPIMRSHRVLAIPKSRVGAKLVSELIEETTAWAELEKLELARKVRGAHRAAGSGRPTKRDRRDMEHFTDG